MPQTFYIRNDQQAVPRKRDNIVAGDALRRGAKQNLRSLDRTIGGHVANLMPHEYNGRVLRDGNTYEETPRTARAFASNNQILPNISRDMKKKHKGGFDSKKNKSSSEELCANKENMLNNHQRQQQQQQQQHLQRELDATEGKCNREDYKNMSSSIQEGKENSPLFSNNVSAAPVEKNGRAAEQGDDYNPATPTRLYVGEKSSEGDQLENNNEEYEDPSEFENAPDICIPPVTSTVDSPTLRAAHQWEARSQNIIEGKFSDSLCKLPISPLRSPHPKKRNYYQDRYHYLVQAVNDNFLCV
jgi:hypothetical protein